MKSTFITILLYLLVISCASKKNGRTDIKSIANKSKKENFNNPEYIPLSNFKGDTLNYLQTNFLKNKEFYIGKNLNVLFGDLTLSIKGYSIGASANNILVSPDLSLNFYNKDLKEKKRLEKKNPLVLYVKWEIPLLMEDIIFLGRKNQGNWTEEERNYFGQFKIKDIGMVVPNY